MQESCLKGYLKTAVILLLYRMFHRMHDIRETSPNGNGLISSQAAASEKVIRIGGKDADIAGFILTGNRHF